MLLRASAKRVSSLQGSIPNDASLSGSQFFRQRVHLTAVPIVEALDCCPQPVDHAQSIPVTLEVQSLARRLKRDLLEIARSSRLQESRLKLLFACEIERHCPARARAVCSEWKDGNV